MCIRIECWIFLWVALPKHTHTFWRNKNVKKPNPQHKSNKINEKEKKIDEKRPKNSSVKHSNNHGIFQWRGSDNNRLIKYHRDRNHKLWMRSFVLYSQQRFYLVHKSTIPLFICRQYPIWREMVSFLQNRHSLSGIFAIPPILPYQMVVKSACYFRFF